MRLPWQGLIYKFSLISKTVACYNLSLEIKNKIIYTNNILSHHTNMGCTMLNRFIEKTQIEKISPRDIINSNLLVDVLAMKNHSIQLTKFMYGMCYGICSSYKLFSHQGQCKDFVFSLMKLASFKTTRDCLGDYPSAANFKLFNMDTSIQINFKRYIRSY